MGILSGMFKKEVSSYLGIDLGTSSIKVVELENVAGRPRLVTYGLVEVETNVSRDDSKAGHEKIADILNTLLAKCRARSREAVAALPNFSVFSSVLSLPELGQQELAEAIQWEAKKFVPMPIENVVLDWKLLDKIPAPAAAKPGVEPPLASSADKLPLLGKEGMPIAPPLSPQKEALVKSKAMVRILLTAAPKHLVERYVSIFKLADINLLSLETESFALGRSLVGNDPAPILVVDVGALTSDLTVVEGGVPVLARSIDVGGGTVTRAIADSLGIDSSRAEQFKRDVGLGAESDGVSRIISQTFGAVVNEMKYSLSLYQGQGKSKIEKILITGGSAFLPSLTDYIARTLGIRAFVANPWARVSHPIELKETLDDLGPRMAIAVGLAMREII